MSIVILGLGKTGTTGMYNTVKDSAEEAGQDYLTLFEPNSPEKFMALRQFAPERKVLTKLVDRHVALGLSLVDDFSHRILVVRDPRDVLISRMLFRPLTTKAVRNVTPDKLQVFLDALRQKEEDPSSVSVWELLLLERDLGIGSPALGGWAKQLESQIEMVDKHDFFVLHYEDFVDGKLERLGEYLGFPVTPQKPRTDGWVAHISRSAKYGEWRHWYLDSDIERIQPIVASHMDRFGYDDWQLADPQVIRSEDASGYIERKIEDRRRQLAARAIPGSEADRLTEDDVAGLVSMAEDGDAVAAVKVAQSVVAGHTGAVTKRRARSLVGDAAIIGSVDAMGLYADLLADPDAGEIDEAASQVWQQRHSEALRTASETMPIGRFQGIGPQRTLFALAAELRRVKIPFATVPDVRDDTFRVAIREKARNRFLDLLDALDDQTSLRLVFHAASISNPRLSGPMLGEQARAHGGDIVPTIRILNQQRGTYCDVDFWRREGPMLVTHGRNALSSRLPYKKLKRQPLTVGFQELPSWDVFSSFRHLEHVDFDIDLVLDGSQSRSAGESALFVNVLRSLVDSLAFVRRVYVVSQSEPPPWLNSSVGGVVWRTTDEPMTVSMFDSLPDLAEHVVLMDDRTVFTRSLRAFDVFNGAGIARFSKRSAELPLADSASDVEQRTLRAAFAAEYDRSIVSSIERSVVPITRTLLRQTATTFSTVDFGTHSLWPMVELAVRVGELNHRTIGNARIEVPAVDITERAVATRFEHHAQTRIGVRLTGDEGSMDRDLATVLAKRFSTSTIYET